MFGLGEYVESTNEDDSGPDWIDEALKRGMGFKTEEERQAYVKSLGDPLQHPMFATSTQDLKDNPLADAIRMLREEDKTMVELANMYKDEGNELIKKKDHSESLGKYDYALSFVDKAVELRLNGTEAEQDKSVNLKHLRSQIISNKALVALNRQNYKTCIDEADSALIYWPENMKAHFRKCKSLLMLKQYDRFQDAYEKASLIEDLSTNIEFSKLQAAYQEQLKRVADQQTQKEKQTIELSKSWDASWAIICSLNKKLAKETPSPSGSQRSSQGSGGGGGGGSGSGSGRAVVGFNTNEKAAQLRDVYPAYNCSEGTYHWPALFLYPQYNQLDVIPDTNVDSLLVEYLAQMFPVIDETDTNSSSDNKYSNDHRIITCNASKKNSERGPNPYVIWDKYSEYQVSNLVVYILLNGSPAIASKEEWAANCREERLLTGIEGADLAAEAIQSMTDRNTTHAKINKHRYQLQKKTCYVEVHLGCSISQILTVPEHVLSGSVLNIIIYVRDNECHRNFIKDIKKDGCVSLNVVQPNGTIQIVSID